MWKQFWEYIYEKSVKSDFGNLDYVFFVSNNFNWLNNSKFTNTNMITYLLHEKYYISDDLDNYYSNFCINFNPKTFIIWNIKDKKTNFNSLFNSLFNLLWKK